MGIKSTARKYQKSNFIANGTRYGRLMVIYIMSSILLSHISFDEIICLCCVSAINSRFSPSFFKTSAFDCFCFLILDIFLCISKSPRPQFYFLIFCSLSRFLHRIVVVNIHTTLQLSLLMYCLSR